MAEAYGNLALKRKQGTGERKNTQVTPLRQTIKVRRITERQSADPRLEATRKARQIRRSLALHQLKMMVQLISVVLILAGLFSFIVFRQARIMEMNFANLRIERQMTRIEQENGQMSEVLAQKTNLDLIRHVAIERLGLQDPARSQMVKVHVPAYDRVVYAAPLQREVDEETYLSSVFSTIEGYFLNIQSQRQAD